MQSEYDLMVLRHLDPVGGRSAMDLAQRMPFGVPSWSPDSGHWPGTGTSSL